MSTYEEIEAWEKEHIPYEARLQFWKNLFGFIGMSKMRFKDENQNLRTNIRYRLKMVDDGNRGPKWQVAVSVQAPSE